MSSDDRVLVETYADLADHDRLSGSQADAATRALLTGSGESVVVAMDDWLADEKELPGVDRFPAVVAGTIVRETDAAWLVAAGGVEDWVPKSCACVFALADEHELSTPQASFGEFVADGGQPIAFDTPDEHGAISYSGVRRPRRSDVDDSSRDRAREWFWRTHDRESYECPDCGRGEDRVYDFEVHHRDGDPTNNDPENLIAVCRRCHVWRHETGPTLSGLDVEEWQSAFLGEGPDSTKRHTVYGREEVTE